MASASSSSTSILLQSAYQALQQNDTTTAFQQLARLYQQNPHTPGLAEAFQACFRQQIQSTQERIAKFDEDPSSTNLEEDLWKDLILDRMGLASLLVDMGGSRYKTVIVEQLLHVVKDRERLLQQKQKQTHHSAAAGNESSFRTWSLPHWQRATALLFRARASTCDWSHYQRDSQALVESLQLETTRTNPSSHSRTTVLGGVAVPAVHPFDALLWPCLSLSQASQIAHRYALRAMDEAAQTLPEQGSSSSAPQQQQTTLLTANHHDHHPPHKKRIQVSAHQHQHDPSSSPTKRPRIRLGYISPDFTGRHPLAFLMQHVFAFHDPQHFEIFLYSLHQESDQSPEVERIRNTPGAHWKVLTPSSTVDDMVVDQLDILIDLCGFTGTSTVAQLLATRRAAPIQIAYMGFPASTSAPFIDWMIADETVISPRERPFYSEKIIYMPDSYFVNSHLYLTSSSSSQDEESTDATAARIAKRHECGLRSTAFVYCCHSRPDKIDPITFRSWMRALKTAREHYDGQNDAVLWLLSSGNEMESNLQRIAQEEFDLPPAALVFAPHAPREEHLRRLQCADLFLDTPAYNAHTVGVDCLSAGVPMVSLLLENNTTSNTDESSSSSCNDSLEAVLNGQVLTDKMASRVGASLLRSVGLDELVVPTMDAYEYTMVRASTDHQWWSRLRATLEKGRATAPLFDTPRWVRNLEAALQEAVRQYDDGEAFTDIQVCNKDVDR